MSWHSGFLRPNPVHMRFDSRESLVFVKNQWEKSNFEERNFGDPQDADARSRFEVSAGMPATEYTAD